MTAASMQVPAAILLLAGGLITCFFGHRVFRLVLGIYGFILGAVLASALMGSAEPTAQAIAMVAGGLVGAAILIVAYFVGVALVGAAAGALAVRVVWLELGADPHVLVVIGASLFGALMALALQRYVIIVGTALGGAWSALVGGFALAGMGDLSLSSGWEAWVFSPARSVHGELWIVAAWLGVGILGMILQFAVTAKR